MVQLQNNAGIRTEVVGNRSVRRRVRKCKLKVKWELARVTPPELVTAQALR
jgi:hypothetical protein